MRQSVTKIPSLNLIQYRWHLRTVHVSHQSRTSSNVSNVFGEASLLSKCLKCGIFGIFLKMKSKRDLLLSHHF